MMRGSILKVKGSVETSRARGNRRGIPGKALGYRREGVAKPYLLKTYYVLSIVVGTST